MKENCFVNRSSKLNHITTLNSHSLNENSEPQEIEPEIISEQLNLNQGYDLEYKDIPDNIDHQEYINNAIMYFDGDEGIIDLDEQKNQNHSDNFNFHRYVNSEEHEELNLPSMKDNSPQDGKYKKVPVTPTTRSYNLNKTSTNSLKRVVKKQKSIKNQMNKNIKTRQNPISKLEYHNNHIRSSNSPSTEISNTNSLLKNTSQISVPNTHFTSNAYSYSHHLISPPKLYSHNETALYISDHEHINAERIKHVDPRKILPIYMTYLSRDAGFSFSEVESTPDIIRSLDRGGVIVTAHIGEVLKTISFSLNEGVTWSKLAIPTPLILSDITVSPSSQRSLILHSDAGRIDSSNTEEGSLIVMVDFSGISDRICSVENEDYFPWAIHKDCTLGIKRTYSRKRPDRRCRNPPSYNRIWSETMCECKPYDLECTPGFYRNRYDECVPSYSKEMWAFVNYHYNTVSVECSRSKEIVVDSRLRAAGNKCINNEKLYQVKLKCSTSLNLLKYYSILLFSVLVILSSLYVIYLRRKQIIARVRKFFNMRRVSSVIPILPKSSRDSLVERDSFFVTDDIDVEY